MVVERTLKAFCATLLVARIIVITTASPPPPKLAELLQGLACGNSSSSTIIRASRPRPFFFARELRLPISLAAHDAIMLVQAGVVPRVDGIVYMFRTWQGHFFWHLVGVDSRVRNTYLIPTLAIVNRLVFLKAFDAVDQFHAEFESLFEQQPHCAAALLGVTAARYLNVACPLVINLEMEDWPDAGKR
jgi:hypothetical protein